ncbi:hypothetical protein RB195_008541 [Necator americanus]|uniref:Methyltransferase domain protein n=1 Tax=Necator americanus TaxID=51031 RepID=A0ABR1CQD7_NECAM
MLPLTDQDMVNCKDRLVYFEERKFCNSISTYKEIQKISSELHKSHFIRTKSERSLRSIDTSRWKVDKTYLPRNGVLHYMAEAIFYADAVELSRDCQANVLSLGLGGGQVNGFLHQNFPKMNITVVDISAQMLRMAKKWFDLQSDDHHRVILDDGARFVEEQAAKGVKYDAIILDACHSAPRTGIELMCPVKVFLQKRVIRSISQLLTDGGIIVMNAAAATIGSEDVRSMLRYHFHKFFNYCGHRKSAGFNQAVVIVCIIVWLKSVFFDSRVHLSTVEFFNLISETYGDSRDLFTVLRRIDIESGGGTHSTFYLITPAEHSPRNIDTSRWEVDKAYLFPTSYYHYMAEVLFYANAIELSRDSKANVLSLGLGGGQLNGFLHHNFPKLNITVVELSAQMVRMARKWFNLQTDDHHRVIVDDGVRFVEKEAAKGAKYDALMVDACYANPREEITMCPVRIFLQEHIARSISQVISSRGILIMNVVSISPSPGKLDEAVAVAKTEILKALPNPQVIPMIVILAYSDKETQIGCVGPENKRFIPYICFIVYHYFVLP